MDSRLAVVRYGDAGHQFASRRRWRLVSVLDVVDDSYDPAGIVAQFRDRMALVEPGLVDITEWQAEDQAPDMTIKLVGAVGRRR